jgi:DNA-binding response OmpR family regulator
MTAKRILIVEDEKAIRDMVAFGLRRAGYEVREAEDCREARADRRYAAGLDAGRLDVAGYERA